MTASKFELINSSLKILSDLTWSTVILQFCTSLFIEPFGFAKGTEVGRKVHSLAEPQESSVEIRPLASQPSTESGEQTGVKTVTVIKDDNRHHRQEDLFLIKLSFTSWEKCCRAKSRRTKWAGRENCKRKITTGMRSLAPRRTSQCNASSWKGGLEWEIYMPLGISAVPAGGLTQPQLCLSTQTVRLHTQKLERVLMNTDIAGIQGRGQNA